MKTIILTSLLLSISLNASTYVDAEAYRAEMKNKYGAGTNEARYQEQQQHRYGSDNSAHGEQKRLRDGSGGGQMHGKNGGGGRGKR